MLILIGCMAGLAIAFSGSLLLSIYPYLPFFPVFSAAVIPSVLVFTVVAYRMKPDQTKKKQGVAGFLSLFIVSLLAFTIKTYIEARSVSTTPGASLNWGMVILFNILYSLGAAVLLSPLSYFAIRQIAAYKREKLHAPDNRM